MRRSIAFALMMAASMPSLGVEDCGKNHYILDEPCLIADVRAWRWDEGGTLVVPRQGHAATTLADGRILVTGGYSGVSDGHIRTEASAEIYDPAAQSSSLVAPMSAPRAYHGAVALADGRVLVAGEEIYDPRLDTWTAIAAPPRKRYGGSFTVLRDGRVLIAGGVDADDEALASAEIYDPSSDRWTETGSLNQKRFNHTATALPDGSVLVAGGAFDDFLGFATPATERYDPASGQWSVAGALSAAREWHTATLLDGGEVLVVGGYAHRYSRGRVGYAIPTSYAVVDQYALDTGWVAVAPLNQRRSMHAATRFAGGLVLVNGGNDWLARPATGWAHSEKTEIYDPSTRTWLAVADTGVGRASHTLTALPDGRVVAIGGDCEGGITDRIEIFGPSPAR